MPGMNGVDLAILIRDRYPPAGGADQRLQQRAGGNRPSGFELIRKPYSVEALARTLRKAIPERPSNG